SCSLHRTHDRPSSRVTHRSTRLIPDGPRCSTWYVRSNRSDPTTCARVISTTGAAAAGGLPGSGPGGSVPARPPPPAGMTGLRGSNDGTACGPPGVVVAGGIAGGLVAGGVIASGAIPIPGFVPGGGVGTSGPGDAGGAAGGTTGPPTDGGAAIPG